MQPDAQPTNADLPVLNVLNIAAYKFVPLTDLEARREQLRTLTTEQALRGTIQLSPEGVNLVVAGSHSGVASLRLALESDPEIGPLEVKQSHSDHQPFKRMLVKLKREIIAFGIKGIEPAQRTSPKLPASELKAWLDEGRRVTLLDVRNDYEIELGTFEGAEPIGVGHFRDFPAAVDALPSERKEETVVMFCTGGIRCEKAGPYMEQAGFQNVYQLEGGILKYFEECGDEHYQGECFVFDQRVALNGELQATDAPERLAGSQVGWRQLDG